MEPTERDLAMGNQGGELGPDGGEVVTDPIVDEPKEIPVPPIPERP
jgi:hypothetical protein